MATKQGFQIYAYDNLNSKYVPVRTGNQTRTNSLATTTASDDILYELTTDIGASVASINSTLINIDTTLTDLNGEILSQGVSIRTMTNDLNSIDTEITAQGVSISNIVNYTKLDFNTRCGRGDFGTSTFFFTKWGQNDDLTASTEEIISPQGGTFNVMTDIMSTAQTLKISYDSAFDGSGTSGATSLFIQYLDANYNYAEAAHVLGNTGSDTTAFTCFGVNRAYVVSTNYYPYNQMDITFTASTDLTIQTIIKSTSSVSNGIIYHVAKNRKVLLNDIFLSTARLSGTNPKVIFKMYSYSRITGCRYIVEKIIFDTNTQTHLQITKNTPLIFGEREVIFITGESDASSTIAEARYNFTDTYFA